MKRKRTNRTCKWYLILRPPRQAVIHMEWRENYRVIIDVAPTLSARIDVPLLRCLCFKTLFVDSDAPDYKPVPVS